MKVFISAGESSSDLHGAYVLKALKSKLKIDFVYGLGGEQLAAEGMQLWMHAQEFSVMGGPLEVVSKLAKRRFLEKKLEKSLYEQRPDFALLIDNGEINLRLSALLNFFGVPIVYFIPPKVWVWRHSRIEKLAQHASLVLSILPFETPIYKEWGIPFEYIGNPLIEEVPLDFSSDQAKQKLGLSIQQDCITVFFGSRHSEIQYHLNLFSEAVKILKDKLLQGKFSEPQVLVPIATNLDFEKTKELITRELPGVKCFAAKDKYNYLCLKAARVALVKSGTSTLEAAVLGVPSVLSYRSSKFSEWIYKYIVRYKGYIGMANLFLEPSLEVAMGWEKSSSQPVMPELILDRCTPNKIAEELFKIYTDSKERKNMLDAFQKVPSLLRPPAHLGHSPIEAAVHSIIKMLRDKNVC